MTTVTTNGARRRAARGAGPLANERGMLLVITMIILLVVSTLAAANLINAFLERSLAQNTNNASVALNAADGAVSAGLAWLNNTANLGTIPTTPNPWTRPGDPATRTLVADPFPDERDGSVRYTTNISFKLDTEDQDCDGVTTDVVVFNKGGVGAACPHDGLFPYAGAIFTGVLGDEGYPVITINAKGYIGTLAENRGYREIEMDVARNKLNAQVEGAFTARSGVTASGSSMTDGRNHDLDGNLVVGGTGCNAPKPGVTVDAGTPAPPCGTNIVGTPCSAVYDPTAPGKSPLQKTPWGVLGISRTDFDGMFTAYDTDQLLMPECYNPTTHVGEANYVWFKSTNGAKFNNASVCDDYKGIIVIHNELFDADEWEARCFAGSTDAYCTADANGDGDADYAPAVFNMDGNVSWTGIVIADQVVKVTGTPTIRGGILSLASGGVIETDITGNIRIEYSCEAVQGATNQGYKTRLGWHRLR